MSQCCHLHTHSRLSFYDGLNPITELAERAHALGQPGIALTDHGVMYGAAELFKVAKHLNGFTAVIGMEAYEADPHTFDVTNDEHTAVFKTAWDKLDGRMRYYHLTLWAMNVQGYRNLVALHTQSFTAPHRPQGKKQLIDRAMLERHSEGIMVGLGCPASRMNVQLAQNSFDPQAGYEAAKFYVDTFPGRVYMEVMANLPEQLQLMNPQRKLAKMLGISCVATNDVHYRDRIDGVKGGAHHALVQGRRFKKADTEESQDRSDEGFGQWYGSDGFFLKSYDEMLATGGWQPAEIARTLEILERCDDYFYNEEGEFLRKPLSPIPIVPESGSNEGFDRWVASLDQADWAKLTGQAT